MKNLLILIAFLTVAANAERPAWVDYEETVWSDSGKIYIKIHVENTNLDDGMNMTERRFKDVIASRFCSTEENAPCMYYNSTREGSYWEIANTGTIYQNFQIYRLFSIKDLTK